MNAESRISKQTAPEAKDQQAVQELTRLLSRRRDLLVETRGEPVAPQLLMTPLNRAAKGSADHVQGILLTERPGELASTMANAPFNGAVLGLSDTPRSERKDIGREPAVITASPERVIDHIRRENVDVSNVNTLVIEEATEDPAGYYTDVQYILSKVRKHPRTILFANNASTVTGSEMTILRRPLILRPF